ncbi:MAG: tetratricopeptide repeat protein [Gammaproteobacteria bacterium]|nr:tetratricopeptide repeat protein [Gammaproteobacteria bacterium]
MNRLRWIGIVLGTLWLIPGHAMTWQDWWKTPDHQAEALWNAGQFDQAAKLFQRPDWRATAAYRAADYQRAAQNYLGLQTTDGYYNAGNALAKSGQYQPAITAYNQALQRDPQHQDALFNRQIVQKLLDKQKQSQSDKQQPSQSQQSPSSSSQNSKSSQQSESKKDAQPQPQKPAELSSPPPKTSEPTEPKEAKSSAQKHPVSRSEREEQQAKEQWLRLIPDDPAYLLREKFLRDHLRRQNGDGGAS